MARLIGLDDVCISGKTAKYSPYGYVIGPDSTVYSLTQQFCHGVICALLFPEKAKEEGYEPPDSEYNVYEYQKFELDHHDWFPVIRVSMGLGFNINHREDMIVTPEQRLALSSVIKVQDVSLSEGVNTDIGCMSLRSYLKELGKNDE